MLRFIGRKEELTALNTLYHKAGFQMTVIYGRRRIGKSTLIQEFMKGKKGILYTTIRNGSNKNLTLLGAKVIEVLAPSMRGMTFSSLEQLFSFMTERCRDERIIFAIDEFPYLAEQDPTVLSLLQKYIDTEWLTGNMYLILCGSSISFMEDNVLSEKSPLFGRRTSQLYLGPFTYDEAADFVPAYSSQDKALCYAVTGGVAKYLALFDETRSVYENITDLFFSKTGLMYEEPDYLLTQEFRHVASYGAVLDALSSGKTKLNDIADTAHIEQPTVSHILKNLMAVDIVKKNMAITDERNKRKVQYVLSDSMLQFWYRFIPAGIDVIELSMGETYFTRFVKPHLAEYMGSVFEDMCRMWTLKAGMCGKLACDVYQVGKWWGTNPALREETDIDVVGLNPVKKLAVLGECKYKNELLDKSVFDQLRTRNNLISREYRTVQYLLFSKSGFSPWIHEHAASEDIFPVTLEDLYTPIH